MTLLEAFWEILRDNTSAVCPDCDRDVKVEFEPDIITDLLDKIGEYKEGKCG